MKRHVKFLRCHGIMRFKGLRRCLIFASKKNIFKDKDITSTKAAHTPNGVFFIFDGFLI